MNVPTEKEYCHERMGDAFEASIDRYDVNRRVEVLVDEFLSDEMIAGKSVLDVGCGLGFFSRRLQERGAQVVACDIGPGLVQKTRERVGCRAEVVDALELVNHFGAECFDGVVSSECIEHTRSPEQALRQMAGVLKPGGYLSVSTPNALWYPPTWLATRLKIRPYDGFETFTTWRQMRGRLNSNGVSVLREKGLHLFPFQFHAYRLSAWCDRHLQVLRGLMINLCVLGVKRAADSDQSLPAS